jgi:hypothetical protein
MKIELVTDFSTVANLVTRLSRPAPLPVRGIRGGMFLFCTMEYIYLYIYIYIYIYTAPAEGQDRRGSCTGPRHFRGPAPKMACNNL